MYVYIHDVYTFFIIFLVGEKEGREHKKRNMASRRHAAKAVLPFTPRPRRLREDVETGRPFTFRTRVYDNNRRPLHRHPVIVRERANKILYATEDTALQKEKARGDDFFYVMVEEFEEKIEREYSDCAPFALFRALALKKPEEKKYDKEECTIVRFADMIATLITVYVVCGKDTLPDLKTLKAYGSERLASYTPEDEHDCTLLTRSLRRCTDFIDITDRLSLTQETYDPVSLIQKRYQPAYILQTLLLKDMFME